jgi:hypothetical protein
MKKLITSKPFIAGSLAVLCVAILAVCFLWGKDKPIFIVEDPVPLAGIDSWTENSLPPDGATGNTGYPPAGWQVDGQKAKQPKEYPKIIEENDNEIVIDFIDPDPIKGPPPEPPEPDPGIDLTDPDNPPPKTTVKPNDPPSNTPNPGGTNEKGEVYVPGFGWVMPGKVEQIEGDSTGDPNKIIGNMN